MAMPTRREFLTTTVGACASTALAARLDARAVEGRKPDDVTALSLWDAGDLLQARKISPVELTTACLARIELLNPALNAFITVTGEQALADARAAESEIARGRRRGPLHGIPIALKDLFDTAGVPTRSRQRQ